jgi:hypothetical protein
MGKVLAVIEKKGMCEPVNSPPQKAKRGVREGLHGNAKPVLHRRRTKE